VSKAYAHTGGKGVNVSRCIRSLGGETKVTGMIGRAGLDDATNDLRQAGIAEALFAINGSPRQTVTVTAADGTTTAFDEPGPTVESEDWVGFEQHFKSLVADDTQLAVIAGSLPPGLPDTALQTLCRHANDNDVPVILDARGPALTAALDQRPLVVKLNRAELAQTLDRDIHSEDDAITAAQELRDRGPRNVIVTLGDHGAIGITDEGAYRVTHPAAAGNPIGAGDAFSAALALTLLDHNIPFERAIKRGAAAALASLNTPTAGALNKDDFTTALATVETELIRKAVAR
jgi:tagatose 6-phosphate kinase